MKISALQLSLIVTLGVLLTFSGCSNGGPPEPLSPDRAITELTRAFAKSKPEMKEAAGRVVAALQVKNYTNASALLMQLSSAQGLGAKERDVASRAKIGVNQLLQEAQAKGDQQSAEYLRQVRQAK